MLIGIGFMTSRAVYFHTVRTIRNTVLFLFYIFGVHPAKWKTAVSTIFLRNIYSSLTFSDFITIQIVFLQENNVPFLSANNYSGDHYRAGCRVKKQSHTLSSTWWVLCFYDDLSLLKIQLFCNSLLTIKIDTKHQIIFSQNFLVTVLWLTLSRLQRRWFLCGECSENSDHERPAAILNTRMGEKLCSRV